MKPRTGKPTHPHGIPFTFSPSASLHSLPQSSLSRETLSMPKGAEQELLDKWKIADAVEMFGIRNWGKGYFTINKAGHITVLPNKRPDESIDLKELIDQLQARGIQLP